MNELDKTSFEKLGGEMSKAAIFTFIITFLYIAFTSEVSFGLLGGTFFLVGGIFVVSIGIAMPFMFLKVGLHSVSFIKDAKIAVSIIGIILDIAYLALVVLATLNAHIWIFS